MKKVFLAFAIAVISLGSASAQETSGGFHFGGGLRLGLPMGDFKEFQGIGIGLELQGEYLFSPMISGTITTGYTSFMGKDVDLGGGTSIKTKSMGYIPILAGLRVYPSPNFFIGAKAGYGMFTGSGESDGGFNYEPQIGYNGTKIQIALGYNGWSKDGSTLNHLGLSGIYKFN